MWGVIPAAGVGSRIQPLAFSKELLPVGSRRDGGTERPRAASEYLIDRMLLAGVDKICFVISPQKFDILQYYCGAAGRASAFYAVQPEPAGLCDAIFRSLPLISPHEQLIVGLPDTIWFPEDALCSLPPDGFSFLLFPVKRPELFDAVVMDAEGRVLEIQVKQLQPRSNWIWGAFQMTGGILYQLYQLWQDRRRQDEYIGTLVNEYLRRGGSARGVRAGSAYVDVGTLNGYRSAMKLLSEEGTGRQEIIGVLAS